MRSAPSLAGGCAITPHGARPCALTSHDGPICADLNEPKFIDITSAARGERMLRNELCDITNNGWWSLKMRKILVVFSAAAMFAVVGSAPQTAGAATFGNPGGIAAAQED